MTYRQQVLAKFPNARIVRWDEVSESGMREPRYQIRDGFVSLSLTKDTPVRAWRGAVVCSVRR